jgi:signal transduction histidine kinase
MDPVLSKLIFSEGFARKNYHDPATTDSNSSYISIAISDISGYIMRKVEAERYRVYCSGFVPGYFVKIERNGPNYFETIGTRDATHHVVRRLLNLNPKTYLNHTRMEDLCQVSKDNRELIIWLYGRGEFFGFIQFTSSLLALDFHAISEIKKDVPHILHFLAEENFAFRVNALLEPLGIKGADGRDTFSPKAVVQFVTRCFGADGAILRLVDQEGFLPVEATDGIVNETLIEMRAPGRLVSGKLAAAKNANWAAIVMDDASYTFGGMLIDREDRDALRGAGIQCLVIAKLWDESIEGSRKPLGTISYYFMRPSYFSRRDLTLFRAFCRRVSDRLVLERAFEELKAKAAILEAQGRRMTYVEVANLLAHDLWHKSQAARSLASELGDLLDSSVKSDNIKGNRHAIAEILAKSKDVMASTGTLHSSHNMLKSIQGINPGQLPGRSTFGLLDKVRHVEKTLMPALNAQKITLNVTIPNSIMVEGPEVMFEQVIFNLFINTIDAAKSRPRTRPMKIDVNAHESAGRVVFRFQDDGPGIDPQLFPNEQEVFVIGRTSKKDGTGTGLAIARQIIGSHFRGNLTLTGRRPPLFTIDVPAV